MLQRRAIAALLAIAALYPLYFYGLGDFGVIGPDEPRYAAIGREMTSSGDWVTPRLWGEPWFEKPVLLYWMTGAGFLLGLNEHLAPRLPVALASVAFLLFFYRLLAREFGASEALYSAIVLAGSAGWLAYSHVSLTDLPMAAAFSTAMLCALPWLKTGQRRWLLGTAVCLGLAVLAKGLVPLALALPLLWVGRPRIRDLFQSGIAGAFLLVTAPWYALCYARNGEAFVREFFWEHHLGRFTTDALQHQQPVWFFVPVLLGALFPWTALLPLLFQKPLYQDPRTKLLLLWPVFGFLFFSASTNKLPGYLLPLLPALAALIGIALARARDVRWMLAAAAVLLILVPVAAGVLPRALAAGLSRSQMPPLDWRAGFPVIVAAAVWWLEASGRRDKAIALLGAVIVASVLFLKCSVFPALDRQLSAHFLWKQIQPQRQKVCIEELHRSRRYELNYYSVTPLPDCGEEPKEIRVKQEDGAYPFLVE